MCRSNNRFCPFTAEACEDGASTLPSLGDEEIMARLQTRDKTALPLLFRRYSRLVFTIARRILRDHGEAEELVQEAFLYIFRRATLFDPSKGSAGPYHSSGCLPGDWRRLFELRDLTHFKVLSYLRKLVKTKCGNE